MNISDYSIETRCIQAGYEPKNGEPRVMPIYQSTTYKYDCGEEVAKLFDFEAEGHIYSRISNPTVAFVENKINALEGGVGALCTGSGASAIMTAVLNICSVGDHIISTAAVYGGTLNLFAVTLKRLGIEVTFIDADASNEQYEKAFRPSTKLLYTETISNPALVVPDFERLADIAHSHGVPFFVDNSFASPVLFRPLEWGADVVLHSTSKYMDGHATVMGGVIVDGGSFDWTKPGFEGLSTPDESYHGVVYTEKFGRAAFVNKARAQLARDIGPVMSPLSAFLLNLTLETLALRMRKHSDNALKIAEWLQGRKEIPWVDYRGHPDNRYYENAKKYLKNGASGVIAFGVKGGREAAMKLMDSLELAKIVVHVADARTCCIHPASTTHRQLTEEQLVEAGVKPEQIRFSVGIEDADDIIRDLENGLNKLQLMEE